MVFLYVYDCHGCCVAGDDSDIIDETMGFFKANVFFKSYEVKVSCV